MVCVSGIMAVAMYYIYKDDVCQWNYGCSWVEISVCVQLNTMISRMTAVVIG